MPIQIIHTFVLTGLSRYQQTTSTGFGFQICFSQTKKVVHSMMLLQTTFCLRFHQMARFFIVQGTVILQYNSDHSFLKQYLVSLNVSWLGKKRFLSSCNPTYPTPMLCTLHFYMTSSKRGCPFGQGVNVCGSKEGQATQHGSGKNDRQWQSTTVVCKLNLFACFIIS